MPTLTGRAPRRPTPTFTPMASPGSTEVHLSDATTGSPLGPAAVSIRLKLASRRLMFTPPAILAETFSPNGLPIGMLTPANSGTVHLGGSDAVPLAPRCVVGAVP